MKVFEFSVVASDPRPVPHYGHLLVNTGTNVTSDRMVVVVTPMAEARSQTPAGSMNIGDLVALEESTPEGKAGMQKARADLSALVHGHPAFALKTMRLSEGHSQSSLAKLVGSSQGHIARIESGRVDVQVGTLVKIAQALNVDPGEYVAAFVREYSKR